LVRGCRTQPESLQSRQDFGSKIRQFGEIINEVERQTLETRGVEPDKLLGDRVRIPNSTVGPARQYPALNLTCATAPEHALRVGATLSVARMHIVEISQRSPIGVVDNVSYVVLGFLQGGPTDNAYRRPDLDSAPLFTRQTLRLSNALTAILGCVDPIEVQVRVADGEATTGW
jgi:hypothetical protein